MGLGCFGLLAMAPGPVRAQTAASPAPAASPASAAPAATAPAHVVAVTIAGIAPSADALPPPRGTRARPPRLDTAVLAAQPLISGPRLSPDGQSLAARLSMQGRAMLGIVPLFGDGKAAYLPLDSSSLSLNWFRWMGSSTLLLSVGKTVQFMGDDAYQTRLVAYDVPTGKMHFLGESEEGLKGDDVLWFDPEGKTLLMAYQRTIYDYPSVWSVEVATNKRKKMVDARENVWDWYADQVGVVRAGFIHDGKSWEMIYRSGPNDKFRTVVKAGNHDEDAGMEAARIFQGSDEGYRTLLNEKTGRYALYRFNFATRQRGEMVFGSARNDVDDFDTTEDGREPFSVDYTDSRDQVFWFDKELAEVQASIDKALGEGQHGVIISRSRDHQTLLVHVGSASSPGGYYVYTLDSGTMSRIARVNEKLAPGDLAVVRYVTYKARDGMDIPAYLTLPAGRDPKKLPLIILPHGGPFWVRDHGGFDEEVQFYANRGYAVLQPQFRGSDSFGKAFFDAGKGQWGRAMQNDLDDGMDWLVGQGVVDGARVCIIGSSYGGYAAMWGAIRNPERYRCAASFAGVMDIARQVKYSNSFDSDKGNREDWRKMVQGTDPAFDPRTISPQFNVDKVKVPLLVMHGDKDQRVPFKQSRLFVDALKAAGKPVEFYTLAGEGHGFSSTANEQQWFDRLDAFLAKYNPAD
jgi:dipeptidyl aminopeptidase/acylaminoacyl peptidase